jgi:sulfur carrier protein ThiS
MTVTVKLIGPLIYEAGFGEKEIEIRDGSTVETLLERIRLTQPRPRIIIRNGKAVAPSEILADGDRIAVSPIYSGG